MDWLEPNQSIIPVPLLLYTDRCFCHFFSSRSFFNVYFIKFFLQKASKLKVLDLSYCEHLKRTPDLSAWVSLEILNLEGCDQLIVIDSSISKLELLATLNLEGCVSLQELPKVQDSTETVMPDPHQPYALPVWVYNYLVDNSANFDLESDWIFDHLIGTLGNSDDVRQIVEDFGLGLVWASDSDD